MQRLPHPTSLHCAIQLRDVFPSEFLSIIVGGSQSTLSFRAGKHALRLTSIFQTDTHTYFYTLEIKGSLTIATPKDLLKASMTTEGVA